MENKEENKVKAVIRYSDVKAMLDKGTSKQDIASYYGLNANQMKKAFQKLNLSNTRAKKVSFEIIDDSVKPVTSERVVVNAPKTTATAETESVGKQF